MTFWNGLGLLLDLLRGRSRRCGLASWAFDSCMRQGRAAVAHVLLLVTVCPVRCLCILKNHKKLRCVALAATQASAHGIRLVFASTSVCAAR